jgi:hypothetical protein
MNYVGIDIHKRYSVLCAQDETGQKLQEARIEGHERRDYARFFKQLEGPSKGVLEACCMQNRGQLQNFAVLAGAPLPKLGYGREEMGSVSESRCRSQVKRARAAAEMRRPITNDRFRDAAALEA